MLRFVVRRLLLLVPILLGVRSLGLRRNGYLPKGLMLGHFVLWYGLLRLFVDVSREYDSYWLGIGRGQYFNLFMAAVGLCIVLAARRRSKSEAWMVRRGSRTRAPVFWGERVAFYVLVALCLTIPSGWTQQVLEGFEERRDAASATVTVCGGSRGSSHS